MTKEIDLIKSYRILYDFLGPQGWWPADTPLEVAVGAILTQNTSWQNVEKAIFNLKQKKLMNLNALVEINPDELAMFIKPAGYYNIKSKRLKNFVSKIYKNFKTIEEIKKLELIEARRFLLGINGIGYETADSILLYALEYPIFVIDTYTLRWLERFNIKFSGNKRVIYHKSQDFFMKNLPNETRLFKEYHALIVKLGKEFCKKKPNCKKCPFFIKAQ
ncbi:DNA-3-methyladenine glycosylase III [Thermodesulfobium acidiphilum]|uniref:DNA-3-methyladenine glycosylase III n=1 Tax=Thermodesulfobium acidiphilum TaxID=1794699 RepID=A0A2R4W2T8_THEAF|nr:endonuclease [Thermodesulfobium acidiphilum]AWB11074.1 DNA-3-methyladenine glycosylase III [Thermodesulfobium acidiphilum]